MRVIKNPADFPFGEIGQPSEELGAPRHRKVAALHELWEARRDGRVMPRKADMRPSDMVKFLEHVYMVDILDGAQDFRVRLFGTGVSSMLGGDYAGALLSETPPELHWRGEVYWLAFQRRAPLFYLFELEPFGRPMVTTENGLFPLANEQGEFAHLLCISVGLPTGL